MDAQSKPSRAENNAKKVAGWLFYLAIFASTNIICCMVFDGGFK